MKKPGIKNFQALVDADLPHSVAMARRSVLTAYEEALATVDPFLITKKHLQTDGRNLFVAGKKIDPGVFRRISVVGAGKAGVGMAAAVEDILGERIVAGCVNVPEKDNGTDLRRIEIRVAGHPLQDEAGVAGAGRILEIAGKAEKDDLLLCLISGGGSSLLPVPRAPVTLADKQLVTSLLLRSGASISEINTVRKHISAIKGGWLAKKAWPATLLSLVLSDVLHDPLEFIASGPTDASGVIVDAAIIAEADRFGLNAEQFLQRCDSYEFLRQTGGLVCTGYTGGNVNDLFALLVI